MSEKSYCVSIRSLEKCWKCFRVGNEMNGWFKFICGIWLWGYVFNGYLFKEFQLSFDLSYVVWPAAHECAAPRIVRTGVTAWYNVWRVIGEAKCWEMNMRCCCIVRVLHGLNRRDGQPLRSLWRFDGREPTTQCKWTWCYWPTTFKWWTSVLIVEVFIFCELRMTEQI